MDDLRLHVSYREPLLLFRGTGTGFRNVSQESGPVFQAAHSARGLAAGDFDNDGAVDVLVAINDGAAAPAAQPGGRGKPLAGAAPGGAEGPSGRGGGAREPSGLIQRYTGLPLDRYITLVEGNASWE